MQRPSLNVFEEYAFDDRKLTETKLKATPAEEKFV